MKVRSRWLRLGLCALLAALLYLPGLGRRALWEPDEGRYAEIAREMVLSRDWVTPRNDWVGYFEKPPLMYWLSAGSIMIFGVNEFAVRLPVALFSIGQLLAAYAIAESMFGAGAAPWAAVSLALSPLFFGFGRFLTLDPALAFFITAALGAFYAAVPGPGASGGWKRRWLLVAAAAMALGTLTKGPVVVVLSGGIAFLYLAAERRLGLLARIPWLACVLVYGAITLPWFWLAASRNPGFLRFFFVHEHIERYLSSTEHGWGPYFFIPVILGGAWPWFFFVPGAIGRLSRDASPVHRSALRFVLIWFGVVFVFFSAPHSKLGSYVLPAIVPLAILSGYALSRMAEQPAHQRRRLLGAFALLSLALAAIAAAALPALVPSRAIPGAARMEALAGLFALALGAVAAFAIGRSERSAGAAPVAIALGALLAMGAAAKALAEAAPMHSYRELARAVALYQEPGCVLASYRHHVQSLPFYTGLRERLVNYRGEIAPFSQSPAARDSFIGSDQALAELWRSAPCCILIANRSDFDHLRGLLVPPPVMIGSQSKKVALWNRPGRSAR